MVPIPSTRIDFQCNHWSGIFKYIRTQSGFNDPHSNNVLHVSTSSFSSGNIINPITVDEDGSTHWASQNEANSWYQISFLENRVSLESYTYRALSTHFFSEWEVLGSDDGVSWEVIHNQTQFTQPSPEGYYTLHFTVDQIITKRIIRFISRGSRFSGDNHYYFTIRGLEFFGQFISSSDCSTNEISHRNCDITIPLYITLFVYQLLLS